MTWLSSRVGNFVDVLCIERNVCYPITTPWVVRSAFSIVLLFICTVFWLEYTRYGFKRRYIIYSASANTWVNNINWRVHHSAYHVNIGQVVWWSSVVRFSSRFHFIIRMWMPTGRPLGHVSLATSAKKSLCYPLLYGNNERLNKSTDKYGKLIVILTKYV